MSDIFISYARENREQAELLAGIFEQQNWSVWWDKVIPPGRKYADVIGAELASAKAVVVLWSRASVVSDWVKDEAQEGVNRNILIPALVDKVQPPYGFRQVQTADLCDWDGSSSHLDLQSLVRGVAGLISKPISASALSTERMTSRRRLLPYLLAGFFVLLLSYAAIRFFFDRRSDGNQNRDRTPCSTESRHKAAELTGKGLMMIDPGGSQAAAVLQFNEALSECSDYTDAYFWRGQSFVALQQNEKALADFKRILELSSDAGMRQKAQKFVDNLETPRPSPIPTAAPRPTNTPPTDNATKIGASNGKGATQAEIARAQVNEMFTTDKSTRIAATTRLIIERKQDAGTVQMAVKSALAHPENKSGVINTLVYLENVDQAILKLNRADIEKLLDAAKANGAQTADHIRKVQSLLNK
jgi:tetratricopeptide (TPR) repeat protein